MSKAPDFCQRAGQDPKIKAALKAEQERVAEDRLDEEALQAVAGGRPETLPDSRAAGPVAGSTPKPVRPIRLPRF